MKLRTVQAPTKGSEQALQELALALASLTTAEETCAFLKDLCTPAELEAMSDRWAVIPYLLKGVPYRDIHDRTGVSVTTVGRVARTYESGAGGYAIAAGKLALPNLRTGGVS